MRSRLRGALIVCTSSLATACGTSNPGIDAGDVSSQDSQAIDAADVPFDNGLPASWSLEGPGIRVEVHQDPYGYRVYNGDGAPVLDTLGAGTGDGFGALGWTGGTATVRPDSILKGYYYFSSRLEAWRDNWRVLDATVTSDAITLTLARPGEDTHVTVTHRVRAGTLRVEARLSGANARAWEVAFPSANDEGFLGFGGRYNRTNQRGVDVYNWCEEGGIGAHEADPIVPSNLRPNGEAMAYYPVPFFVSTKGYGFWLDTDARSEFNLATTHTDAWRAWHIGSELNYEVYVPAASTADARPWPYQLVDRFTEATGRPMVPPAWTLGPRRRINVGDMQNGVSEIQAMRDLDLAITALDDATHFLPAGSHLGREAELSAWTASARQLGYRVNGYYNSLLSSADDNPIKNVVDEAVANHYVLADAAGTPSTVFLISGHPVDVYVVDFTSPQATQWFGGLFQWALSLGYSGWMYDFGEYVQPEVVSASGLTGYELHNRYPVLYQRAAHDALEAGSTRGDWLTFARSGYTGASQYSPMVWTGDPAASFENYDGLPSMPRVNINLGVAGVPNTGGDIGGYHCIADGFAAANEELLTRWIEQGSTSVNMQDQDSCYGATDVGAKANIFTAPAAQAAWLKYARLHTRLFPYLDELVHQAHETGAPPVRHVFLEHPDRVDLAGVDDEYYFGPALLVAPVVHRGDRARHVILPAGKYLDWNDGTLLDAGALDVPAPLDKLPIFLRDGYLVPMLDPTIDTLAEETDPSIVGPGDVADVYDVVGLVSRQTGSAAFAFQHDVPAPTALSVTWAGGFTPPAGVSLATSDAALSTCAACYRTTVVSPGLTRVQISATGNVAAGGLALGSTVARRIRWDLYLVD